VKRIEWNDIGRGCTPAVDEGKVGCDLLSVIGLKIARGRLLGTRREARKDPRPIEGATVALS
jgi:hypothetical protein